MKSKISLGLSLFLIGGAEAFAQEANPGLSLSPLIEPPPVPFSFNAPGWYLVAGILLISAIAAMVRWLKAYRANTYRRNALKELYEIDHKTNLNLSLARLFIILKSVAIQAYGRSEAGPLSGARWLQYLDKKASGVSFTSLEPVISRALLDDKPVTEEEYLQLFAFTKKWIKSHA